MTAAVRAPIARAIASCRTAPVSWAYLALLVATTAVQESVSPRTADRLLLAHSTNLVHLSRDPVRVLVSSAYWLSDASQLVLAAVLLLVVVAAFERRVGSRRTLVVLAAGHVLATLLTAAGLWVAVHADAVERSVVHARDVGPSYALFAVAAALTYLVDARLRRVYVVALLGYALAMVVFSTTFTDFGHLLAILVGLACRPVVRSARPKLEPFGSRLLLEARRPDARWGQA